MATDFTWNKKILSGKSLKINNRNIKFDEGSFRNQILSLTLFNSHWVVLDQTICPKMSKLKSGDLTVLLFNSKKNTPNLNYYSFFDYPQSLDKHMVCGYWRFNYEKFCYGGVDEDGNSIKCEEK